MLEMRRISKRFPGIKALSQVNFRLFPGEVHALMGQNGAGKSTLVKVLTGVYPVHEGEIVLCGETISPASPQDAQALGISTVFQEENLCPNLSVAENLFIGRFPKRRGLLGSRIDWDTVNQNAEAALGELLHLQIDVTRQLSSYSFAIQQMVAIARAIAANACVLILDEPTSSLHEKEVRQLFGALRKLKSRGVAILFVTHFLDQVYAIADRITVLRNGELEGEYPAGSLPRLDLVSKMMGRDYTEAVIQPAEKITQDVVPPLLSARQLTRSGNIQPFDLDICAGEVLGLAGLIGSGRSEMARTLFGIDPADSGELSITCNKRPFSSPHQAIMHGLGFSPEDRKTQGIIAGLSVRENIILALQAKQGWLRSLSGSQQRAIANQYIQALGIGTPDAEKQIDQLSGGNQQKVLLARWLAVRPLMLILDEPTRGIDVGAKQEIMVQVQKLGQEGMAILFISSEIEELLRVSQRALVIRDRVNVAELDAAQTSETDIMRIIAESHS